MAKFKHNPITNELDLIGADIAAAVLDTVSGSLVFNKGNSTSIDFQAKSLNSDTIFFIDSSADRVGFGLSGLLPTDGFVHIRTGDAGVITASAFADELVIEGTGVIGTTWLTTTTGSTVLAFADTDNSLAAFLQYNHTTDVLFFQIGSTEHFRVSSSGVVINELVSSSVDFRCESLNSANMFLVDASADRVGIALGSLAPTDGLLHIQSGTAGAVTASLSANLLVLEGNVSQGLSILTPATVTAQIFFGSTIAPNDGKIVYDHTTRILAFGGTGVSNVLEVSNMGVVINNLGTSTNDFRIEGDTTTHLFFIDVGTQNLIINGSVSATSSLGNLHINNGTSPTAVLADGIVLGSKNSGVGSVLAVPELWIENPPEVIGTFTPSHKFKTWINGTEYFIQLDAV